MKNISFVLDGTTAFTFDRYFKSYDFPIVVENGMLLTRINGADKKIKIEGTKEQFELEEFDKLVQLFRSQDIKWKDYNELLSKGQQNNKPHFERVEKHRKEINQYLVHFSEKWNKKTD